MACQLPPPLSDDEISALLDGTAEEGVVQHVALCPDCASRVAAARQLEAAVARRLNRWDCPPAQTLGEYHLGLLDLEEQHRVAAHLANCLACQAELAELAAYLSDEPTDAAAAAGPAPEAASERPPAKLPRRLPETLLGTVLTRRPAMALRGTGDEPVIVQAGDMTLYLYADAGAGRPVLLGQLAGNKLDDWVGALVQLWQDGGLRATTEVGQFGSFRCESFDLRPFELRIASQAGPTLFVPQINLTD